MDAGGAPPAHEPRRRAELDELLVVDPLLGRTRLAWLGIGPTQATPQAVKRGITLSAVQVWRLVTQTPERLSLPVLAALCDIFDCPPGQLIATRAQDVTVRRVAGQTGNVVDLATTMRPKRARITPE